MGWTLLLSGILINIAGVIGIKLGQTIDQDALGVVGYVVYFLGFFVISLSFRHLDVGLAYAFWSGLGCLLVIGCGVLFFNESLSAKKLLFFALVMVGTVGISFSA